MIYASTEKRLLDQVRDRLRLKNYASRTEQSLVRFTILSTFEYLPLWIGFVTLSGYPDSDCLRAIVGALIFSGAVAFQLLMQASGVQVSPFLLDTMPYLLTLLVLIAWGGNRKQSAPASLGRVYHGTE